MRCHGIRGKPSFIFNLTNPRIDWAISLCCMACPRRYGRYKLRNDRFMFHAQNDFWYGSKIVSWRSKRIAGVASLMGCHQDHYINRNKNRIRSHLRIQEQWTRTVASRKVNLEKIDGTVMVWNRVFSAISTKSYRTNTEKKIIFRLYSSVYVWQMNEHRSARLPTKTRNSALCSDTFTTHFICGPVVCVQSSSSDPDDSEVLLEEIWNHRVNCFVDSTNRQS